MKIFGFTGKKRKSDANSIGINKDAAVVKWSKQKIAINTPFPSFTRLWNFLGVSYSRRQMSINSIGSKEK